MRLKKYIGKIHLWLGLSSGAIVLLLGITGCILAFELEIRSATEPFRYAKEEAKPMLPPSALKAIAEKHLASGKAVGVQYPGRGMAAVAMYFDADHFEQVFLNPYNGAVLKYKNMNRDFFRVVLAGHYNLWLPVAIGQPITATATLIFVVMMITGLILWWPRSKAARKQRFTVKWQARWRRRNYDLHNVLGFYMTWVAIFLALTGLVFGFQWFAKSVYWVSSGGTAKVEDKHPDSDTTKQALYSNIADHLFETHRKSVGADESIGVYFAGTPTDPVEIVINHRPGTYYKSDFYHYDQYTGKHLEAEGSWDGKFSEATIADKIVRMNYDMHVGAIFGLPGKMLAFFASLIAASLPVTGFLVWWGRRKKGRLVKKPVAKLELATG